MWEAVLTVAFIALLIGGTISEVKAQIRADRQQG